MSSVIDAPKTPSLDGREFVMESSTASAVDPASPSRFRYSERDGVVWGGYDGDTVAFGRFVGTRSGDLLDISFAHVLVEGGAVVTGSSRSTVQAPDPEGPVRLVEDFRIGDVDHVSVCVEVHRHRGATLAG
jgi:hypothetical protein